MSLEARPYPTLPDSVLEMFSLRGKVAAVTGSASGIGFQVVEAYAEAGADVAMLCHHTDTAIASAQAVAEKYGVKVIAYKCPVTDPLVVEETINQVVRDFGRLDIFVANAGVGKGFQIANSDLEDWKWIMDVNLNGVYYAARAVGSIFEKQGSGNFIITSSMSAKIANIPVNQACYCASKAAVSHFARCLAVEWKHFARVNTVSPGYMDTDMGIAAAERTMGKASVAEIKKNAINLSCAGRDGSPKELKGAYLYLASDASTFTTGSDIVVDGGYTTV